jgi:energy-coupling factor transporter ATP-binding protein EcfA2
MIKKKTHLVFTPTSPAMLSFVERDDDVNDELVDAMRIPGMQVIMYGPSGAGKTTLLINKLNQIYENHIITRCMIGMSMEQIILDGFDQLNAFYTSSTTTSAKSSISSELKNSYLGLKAIIENQLQEKSTRIIPIQLTAQRLAQYFGSSGNCWVLEDFHKMDQLEKIKLSQIMKVFMDSSVDYPDLKIIAVGAVDSAREVVKYDPEMKQRVSEIYVPLMNDNEIAKIISKGEELLNISVETNIAEKILIFSSGLPSVCHHLCLIMCTNQNLYETSDENIKLNEEDFVKAVEKYVKASSDTLKEIFDKAIKIKRVRKYNNPEIILKAILDLGEDGLTYNQILNRIKKSVPEYPAGNLTLYLKELQTPVRGEILRFDKNAGKYSFSSPFVKTYSHCLLTKHTKNQLIPIRDFISSLSKHFNLKL